jgi:hypothetical protein
MLLCSVSATVWRDTCIAYARQLAEDGQTHKAVTYLLSAGKVYEAIGLLRSQALIKYDFPLITFST